MDSPDVKKEVDDLQLRTPSSAAQGPVSAAGEQHLAHCPTSNPTVRKKMKRSCFTEKKQKRFKIKKSQSETIIKHAVLDHGVNSMSHDQKSAGHGKAIAETKSPAMIRAEEVQSNLEPQFPSFAKSMVRSHVASCFWMGLPGLFCKSHLPRKDTMFVLEDESGKQFEAKYFADKTGLSAGWRQFCTAHNLLEGDVLVFQLVEPTKFKVYIVRANDLTELDGALGLLNLDAHVKQSDAETDTVGYESTKRKRSKPLPLVIVEKKNKRSGQQRLTHIPGQPGEQSENDSEEVGSEVLEGSKLSVHTIQFKDVTSFKDFIIFVDGMVIDSELSEEIRIKYYELCYSQNAFLHENLVQGINSKLVVGTVSETVNIADAVRVCKLTTSRDEFDSWDKTLKAFELLGMNVGFLRARISRLVNLAFESEASEDTRRYLNAKAEQARIEDETRNLESKIMELKDAYERVAAEIESLRSKAERYELGFQEEVCAPW